MNYQNQRKELGLDTKGSVGDLTSTLDGSKWHHGVDAAGIAKLTKIQTEISDAFDKGAREYAKMQINIGRLLNDARALIPGDQQFGQWRAENTPITNKSTANKLMNLAKQVGDGRITQQMVDELPLSNLKELLAAPDHVITHIRDTLRDGGELPTRDEIRDMKKGDGQGGDGDTQDGGMMGDLQRTDEQPEPEVVDGTKEPRPIGTNEVKQERAPKAPAQPPQPTRPQPAQVIPKVLDMSFLARLRRLDPAGEPPYSACKPEEWAWLVFGLDPMPAYNPDFFVVETLGARYDELIKESGAKDTDALLAIFNRAEKIIHEQYGFDATDM